MKKVLLTGISGFVGQHCAVELLKQGYKVKGSVRDLSKIQQVRDGLAKVIDLGDNLEFCELNLLSDSGWDDAVQGCDYVLHVASPFIIAEPKDENVMIKPAVEGTLRALTAAKKAGIKKVVLTSSTVAMAGDTKVQTLTQASWTNVKTDNVTVYMKSKTLAERAAWDFYNKQSDDDKMELTVVNPGPIYGPTLTGNLSGESMTMIKKLITGKIPALPKANYVMSDVRDVAFIHVQALENQQSNGQRFIVTTEQPHTFMRAAEILKEVGYNKSKPMQAPSFIIKLLSHIDSEMKGLLPFVDSQVAADISATKEVFNWTPLAFEKTIVDSAKSIETFS